MMETKKITVNACDYDTMQISMCDLIKFVSSVVLEITGPRMATFQNCPQQNDSMESSPKGEETIPVSKEELGKIKNQSWATFCKMVNEIIKDLNERQIRAIKEIKYSKNFSLAEKFVVVNSLNRIYKGKQETKITGGEKMSEMKGELTKKQKQNVEIVNSEKEITNGKSSNNRITKNESDLSNNREIQSEDRRSDGSCKGPKKLSRISDERQHEGSAISDKKNHEPPILNLLNNIVKRKESDEIFFHKEMSTEEYLRRRKPGQDVDFERSSNELKFIPTRNRDSNGRKRNSFERKNYNGNRKSNGRNRNSFSRNGHD